MEGYGGLRIPGEDGNKREILLMDDEESILESFSALLVFRGYGVVTARSGQEAVCAYRKALSEGRKFDVVVMDLTIPGGMGGREAIAELLRIDPGVKAIVSSGYLNTGEEDECLNMGFSLTLPKPFTIRDLISAIEQVTSGSGKKTG
jgi:two-component system cell cycle sensor histidine kinase/response regulator CckA